MRKIFTTWVAAHKVWSSVLGVLVALFIIGSIAGSPKKTDASATPSPTAPQPVTTATGSYPTPAVTVAPAAVRQAAARALLANDAHFRQDLAQATAILLSEPPYSDANAGLAAMNDPTSAASRYRDWRKASGVETDTSYQDAANRAGAGFTADDEPQALGDWRNKVSDAWAALLHYVQTGASYQAGERTRGDLDAERSQVTALLDEADTLARQV